jgi:predicted Zn-dependent protease
MILLHETVMTVEASHLKNEIEAVFSIPVRTEDYDLERFFFAMPEFGGYHYRPKIDVLTHEFPGTAVLVLTCRDLYDHGESKDDEWVFGGYFRDGEVSVAATARLLGQDNKPRKLRQVELELYLRRLTLLAIHELGHGLVTDAPHQKRAAWVNLRSGIIVELGKHCDDNSCVMYESVDLTAPVPAEGYLQLDNEYRFDAGLDQHLSRIRKDWFCPRCRNHLTVAEPYRRC